MKLDGANFDNALTDNLDLVTYMQKHKAKPIPLLLNSKSKLKNKLQEYGYGEYDIEMLLKDS